MRASRYDLDSPIERYEGRSEGICEVGGTVCKTVRSFQGGVSGWEVQETTASLLLSRPPIPYKDSHEVTLTILTMIQTQVKILAMEQVATKLPRGERVMRRNLSKRRGEKNSGYHQSHR